MSDKHSRAALDRLGKTAAERSEKMRKVVQARWAKTSKEDRSEFAHKLVKARARNKAHGK